MTKFLPFLAFFGLTLTASATSFSGMFSADFTDTEMSIEVTVDDQTDMVHFKAIGPATTYFAFGFDGTSMNGTYALVLNQTTGSVSERSLGDRKAGTELTSTVSNISSSTEGELITIEWDRNITGADANYYTFVAAEGIVNLIYSKGGSQTFAYHGNSNKGSSTISFTEDVVDGVADVINAPTITMYPNPTQNTLNLTFSLAQENITARILDLKGATVVSATPVRGTSVSMDVSAMQPGSYVLEFGTPLHRGQYVFIKQ